MTGRQTDGSADDDFTSQVLSPPAIPLNAPISPCKASDEESAKPSQSTPTGTLLHTQPSEPLQFHTAVGESVHRATPYMHPMAISDVDECIDSHPQTGLKPSNLIMVDGRLHKIPRPRNAFMIFANENRKAFRDIFPNEANNQISVRLGKAWRNLAAEMKAKYYERSQEEDREHKRKYPFYQYTPTLSRRIKDKKLKMASKEANNSSACSATQTVLPGKRQYVRHQMGPIKPCTYTRRHARHHMPYMPLPNYPMEGNGYQWAPVNSRQMHPACEETAAAVANLQNADAKHYPQSNPEHTQNINFETRPNPVGCDHNSSGGDPSQIEKWRAWPPAPPPNVSVKGPYRCAGYGQLSQQQLLKQQMVPGSQIREKLVHPMMYLPSEMPHMLNQHLQTNQAMPNTDWNNNVCMNYDVSRCNPTQLLPPCDGVLPPHPPHQQLAHLEASVVTTDITPHSDALISYPVANEQDTHSASINSLPAMNFFTQPVSAASTSGGMLADLTVHDDIGQLDDHSCHVDHVQQMAQNHHVEQVHQVDSGHQLHQGQRIQQVQSMEPFVESSHKMDTEQVNACVTQTVIPSVSVFEENRTDEFQQNVSEFGVETSSNKEVTRVINSESPPAIDTQNDVSNTDICQPEKSENITATASSNLFAKKGISEEDKDQSHISEDSKKSSSPYAQNSLTTLATVACSATQSTTSTSVATTNTSTSPQDTQHDMTQMSEGVSQLSGTHDEQVVTQPNTVQIQTITARECISGALSAILTDGNNPQHPVSLITETISPPAVTEPNKSTHELVSHPVHMYDKPEQYTYERVGHSNIVKPVARYGNLPIETSISEYVYLPCTREQAASLGWDPSQLPTSKDFLSGPSYQIQMKQNCHIVEPSNQVLSGMAQQ